MKKLIVFVLSLFVGSCAMNRHLETTTWGPSGGMLTHQVSDVNGLPALIGESHDLQGAPGVLSTSDVSKAQLATVALAGIGAAAGVMTGSAPVAVLGGVGGAAAGKYLDSNGTATSSTAALLAPALKTLLSTPQKQAVAP